jgi:hypothetical protein
MPEEPKQIDLIDSIATERHVLLDDASFECSCFIYAHVLYISGKRLEKRTLNKISLIEMECALDRIHCQINHFKVRGIISEDSQMYSDIDCISPILEIVISRLRTLIEIYDETLPNPRQKPEKLRLRSEALTVLNQGLLECRRYLIEINGCVNWWGNEVQIKSCQEFRSTG